MFGSLLRCSKCNQYTPDRCTCNKGVKMLVQGKIPAFTDCPYRAQCPSGTNGQCSQQGVTHPVPFSCGYARLFAIYEA